MPASLFWPADKAASRPSSRSWRATSCAKAAWRSPSRHRCASRACCSASCISLLVTGGESFRRETQTELETLGGGVALCLPGDRPDMLRGLSLRWPTTSLLIVDEAARVTKSMWSVISPMLAAAPTARQALLSTPAGASGEFHRVMVSGEADWRRIIVRAEDCSRIAPAFLARERIRLGDALFRQEYSLRVHRLARLGIFRPEILSAMFAETEGQDLDGDAPTQAANGISRFVF